MLFQSNTGESFILKTIKISLSVFHLADNSCKKTPKNTFHFQPKLFNVLNNIDPFTTQIFGRIIVPLLPYFWLEFDENWVWWVGGWSGMVVSDLPPSVEVVWSCRQCLRTPSFPGKCVIHAPFSAALALQDKKYKVGVPVRMYSSIFSSSN